VDKSPFTVLADTPLTKVHFLFTMLNISQLFVVKRGVLVGIISKNEFLKSNKHVAKKKVKYLDEDDPHEPLGTEVIPNIMSRSLREEIKEEDEEEELVYEESSLKESNDQTSHFNGNHK
jgi:predicted transcriptional regulator